MSRARHARAERTDHDAAERVAYLRRDHMAKQEMLHTLVPNAALFALTGKPGRLSKNRASLDHHALALRALALASMAYVAPRVALKDEETANRRAASLSPLLLGKVKGHEVEVGG